MKHMVARPVLLRVGCELLAPWWHSLGVVRCNSGSGTQHATAFTWQHTPSLPTTSANRPTIECFEGMC